MSLCRVEYRAFLALPISQRSRAKLGPAYVLNPGDRRKTGALKYYWGTIDVLSVKVESRMICSLLWFLWESFFDFCLVHQKCVSCLLINLNAKPKRRNVVHQSHDVTLDRSSSFARNWVTEMGITISYFLSLTWEDILHHTATVCRKSVW